MIAAMAVAAGAAFAETTPITSANVVGFYLKNINNTFVVRAAQFEDVTGESFVIKDFLKCKAPETVACWSDRDNWEYVDGWEDTAPQIKVMNDAGVFEPYFYISDARGWDGDGNEFFAEGWADNSGCLADATPVPCGSGIWIRGYKNGTETVADTEYTFSGQVLGDDSGDIEGDTTFTVRGTPFPRNEEINSEKCDWSSLTPVVCWSDRDNWEYVEGWEEAAPQIKVMNDAGVFEPYYYISDARGWDGEGNEFFAQGWADNSGCLAADGAGVIKAGEGVWFNPRAKDASCPISK